MKNSSILALDLILTAILQYVAANKSEIDAMPPDEFQAFADIMQAKRKMWLAKYVK